MRLRTQVFCLSLFVHTSLFASIFPHSREEPCPWPELFVEARRIAGDMPVTHSENVVRYVQYKTYPRGADPWMQDDYTERTIPLVLINVFTCELVPTFVTRRVSKGRVPTLLPSDDGRFLVMVEPRAYGALWNWWNTPFRVVMPEGFVVAALHWKRHPSGQSVVYTPGSADVMNAAPTLSEIGRHHFREDIRAAYQILVDAQSLAIPGKSVPNVIETHFPRLLETIVVIEHADDHEVATYREGGYPMNPLERPFAIIGANRDEAYRYTRSKAGALGLMQVMPKTCRDVRGKYRAPIPADCFGEDTHAHPVELATSMLVVDYHLSLMRARLQKKGETPEEFASRPEMRLMVRAAYNTGPGRVSSLVRARKDWTLLLLAETRGYLAKSIGLD